ncbi:MAG: deoxyribonuclease V [Thermodesulfobacteriota bacterium]
MSEGGRPGPVTDWRSLAVSPRQALILQKSLAQRVYRENRLGPVASVAGLDVAYAGDRVRAAVAVLAFPGLELRESATAEVAVAFPYRPGLLSFREGPAILEALGRLRSRPDLLIFDGQGVSHPRRLGLASHVGLLVDLPSIGCAKSRLCGRYEEPGPEKGDFTLLWDRGEAIGAVVRTRRGVKPVFVSIGHRVDLTTGIHFILACCLGRRLPETTRLAHRLAGEWKDRLGRVKARVEPT